MAELITDYETGVQKTRMHYLINGVKMTVDCRLFIPLDPVLRKPGSEMTKLEAKQFFNWFMDCIGPRMEQLKDIISIADAGVIEKMNYSPESLIDVFEWFLNSVNIIERSKEEMDEERDKLPDFLKYQVVTHKLELGWMQIVHDIGVYMSLCFLEYDSRLKWGIGPYPKASGGNTPSILGFSKKMCFHPLVVMNTMMGKTVGGRAVKTQLYDVFKVMIEYLPT